MNAVYSDIIGTVCSHGSPPNYYNLINASYQHIWYQSVYMAISDLV